MWLYWYKDSDIGKNIQEVIKHLDIESTYGYYSSDYPCGVYNIKAKHMYGMTPNKESVYFLITTRDQIYQACLLQSIGFNEKEIKLIIGDTHVD